MDKKQQITPEQQQELIAYNRKRIYRIPDEFFTLQEMIRPVYNDLLQIFKYVLRHGMFRYRGRYTFVAGTNLLTYGVRKRTTTAVTNRHVNYLVALGLLRKEKGSTKANQEFIKANPDKQQIGQYSIPRYTTDYLKQVETRAERMKESGITAGNISQHQLFFNGLPEQALDQYNHNDRSKIAGRETEKDVLFAVIGEQVKQNGYTTKQALYEDERFGGAGEVDKVFRIFKREFLNSYNYKRPTEAEKIQFDLTGNHWIITAKKGTVKYE